MFVPAVIMAAIFVLLQTFQHTPVDSVLIAGGLGKLIAHVVPNLPAAVIVLILGPATAFLMEAAERILTNLGPHVPVLSTLVNIWQTKTLAGDKIELKDFLNPLFVWIIGTFLSGNPFGGIILALVGAGGRSMVIPKASAAAVKATAGAAILALFLMGAKPASAGSILAPVDSLAHVAVSLLSLPASLSNFHVDAGVGERYEDLAHITSTNRAPYWFGGFRYVVGGGHIIPKIRTEHDFKSWNAPWRGRAELVFSF